MKLGEIQSIQIAPDAAHTPQCVQEVQAVSGRGLEGDRYFNGTGTYSYEQDAAHEATFIEAEAMEALAREQKIDLSGEESRRNITTRGVALNHLVGKEFRIGQAVFRGIRLCEPCEHLQEVSGKQVIKGLVHRGGLRAQIVSSGLIRVGDPIESISA
jgi:MOSC domain-containing protein YiiM